MCLLGKCEAGIGLVTAAITGVAVLIKDYTIEYLNLISIDDCL